MAQWAKEKTLVLLFLVLSTEGCKISCAGLQSTHCLPWVHINIGGQEERETYLLGNRYRSTSVLQPGGIERKSLQVSALLVWASSLMRILVFQCNDEVHFAKAKTFITFSNRVATIHTFYLLFLWSSQAHNTPKV